MIESQTSEDYQGNKFNKLLRFVAVIICSILKCNDDNTPIKKLLSVIANPISAWLLINNFDVEINCDNSSDFNIQFEKLKSDPENLKLTNSEIKKKIVCEPRNIQQVIVPLSDKNVEKATTLFNELTSDNELQSIKCVIKKTN